MLKQNEIKWKGVFLYEQATDHTHAWASGTIVHLLSDRGMFKEKVCFVGQIGGERLCGMHVSVCAETHLFRLRTSRTCEFI